MVDTSTGESVAIRVESILHYSCVRPCRPQGLEVTGVECGMSVPRLAAGCYFRHPLGGWLFRLRNGTGWAGSSRGGSMRLCGRVILRNHCPRVKTVRACSYSRGKLRSADVEDPRGMSCSVACDTPGWAKFIVAVEA